MSQDTGAPTTAAGPPGGERPTGRARSRRGVSFWAGIVLVLAGLGMLGYVAWQMYGTTIVSRQTQERLVEDLEQQWAEPSRTIRAEEKKVPAGEVPLGEASALVRIPAFGDDYVVPVVEGVGDDDLTKGYGHFPDSADPGDPGNYALAAHRITHGEPLRNMPALRPGDEVVVETRDAVYTYELTTNPNDLIVTFQDVWVVDPLPTNPSGGPEPAQKRGQSLITLTTCSELFHTDNRMIAFGRLVDSDKK